MKKLLMVLFMLIALIACGKKDVSSNAEIEKSLTGSLVCVIEESGVSSEQTFEFKDKKLQNIVVNTSMDYEALGMSSEDINSSTEEELEILNEFMKELLGADADSKLEFTEEGINLSITVSKDGLDEMGITDVEFDKDYDQVFIDDLISKYESEGGVCKFK